MSRHAAVRARLACAAVLLLAAAPASAKEELPGAVVTLKDGHVLKGYVVQPSETIIDPYSGEAITLHKGLFLVDDYCRRFFFSHAYVDHADTRPFEIGKYVQYPRDLSFLGPTSLPPIRKVIDVGSWSETWDRSYQFETPELTTVKLSQHMTLLSPHYARVVANSIDPVTKKYNSYPWTAYYRTRELGPDAVIALLTSYKDPKNKDNSAPTAEQRVERRFLIFNFLVQAGWLDAAQKELERIKTDFPDQKEKVETAAEGIKKLVALERLDEIKRALGSGRHEAAQKLLAAFPADADPVTLAEVRALKARYDAAGTAFKRAKTLLADLAKDVAAADGPTVLKEAAAAIAEEINLDTFIKKNENEEGRLERFLTQADQAERFAKQNLPHLRPGEQLSLAVTGWLLGPASAETKPAAARRVWEARRFVREYQKTAGAAARAALLKDYEEKSPIGAAEMAQLIANLPPVDAPEKVTSSEVEMKAPAIAGKGTTYRLKLPPEYHAGRPYPVLIALHHGGELGTDMVKRWGDEAGKHGYILACPDWDQAGVGGYTYTSAEHATVLDTLRDLRQHFNVDTDRVFMTGHGEGGNMAWDVGLSHPDLFAGVVPMAGQPMFHSGAYWPNAMDLPFYAVWGERMGGRGARDDQKKTNGNLLIYNLFKDHWIPGGFPTVGVQYKGRGVEWFGAEMPDIFEWMALKHRHNPLKVGWKDVVSKDGDVSEFHEDQRSMRVADNRFYWLTVDGIDPRRLNDGIWTGKITPGLISGKITKGNQISVFRTGITKVTVWLGRGTIDFDKPVTVNLSIGPILKSNTIKVKPSLSVMLEDLIDRGDRQRLYLARIEVK